ncbi:MAG: glycosyltransferase, partial [Planctomycetota bacterium]
RAHEAADPICGADGALYRVVEYVRDMPHLLAAAELVLCRGGASTLAELAAVRVPAWVVPYPHHADRHQERNAAQLGSGVRVVDESQLGPLLAGELASVAGPGGAGERDAMRRALVERIPGDAAQRILQELRLIAR